MINYCFETECPSPDNSGNPFLFFLEKKKRLERIAGNSSLKLLFFYEFLNDLFFVSVNIIPKNE
jgi:hypothetical protein